MNPNAPRMRPPDGKQAQPDAYKLRADSPAEVLTGAPVSELAAVDYFGNRRKSEPSMGAHQYRVRLRQWSRWELFHAAEQKGLRQFAVGTNQDGRLAVFATASDGLPWITTQKETGGWEPWARFDSDASLKFKRLVAGKSDEPAVTAGKSYDPPPLRRGR